MARPPVDSEITVAHMGRILRLTVSGPSFSRGGDISFPAEDGFDRLWLNGSDENVTWTRERVDEETPEAKALLAAEALR